MLRLIMLMHLTYKTVIYDFYVMAAYKIIKYLHIAV